MTDQLEIARRIDEVVAGIAGVREVYAARPLVARVLRTALDDDAPRSHVAGGTDGLAVAVSIGVDDSEASADTARRVAAAVRGILGDDGASVTVRVVRIVPSRAG